MNPKNIHIVPLGVAALLTGLMAGPYPLVTNAADLNLANIPLYLGQEAAPNILFLMDDSGSMDWEVMTTDLPNGGRFSGTQPDGSNPAGVGAIRHRDADGDGSANCYFGFDSDGDPTFYDQDDNEQDFYGYTYSVEFGSNTYGDDGDDCNTADDEAWRFRNSDFNPLYYDPTKTYQPWSGVDANGNAFTDIDVTNAPDDPYDPVSYINLTNSGSDWTGGTGAGVHAALTGGFRYYTWSDSDGDGRFDDGEETRFRAADLTAAQKTNFANWFSYYRSREFVAKAAYGDVIAQGSNVRMGLVTLHDNNSVNTAIAEMNGDPATGAKRALLDALYQFHSSGGTPLRIAANQCGKYLSCESNDLFTSCPRLDLADGGNCQQNFLVMMTDGLWNGGSPSVGNTDGDDDTDFDGGAYADSFSNMLADVAMEFYENDIHTDYPNDLPIIMGVDEADHQHVVTYGVAFGVDSTLSANPTNPTVAFTWPEGVKNTATTVDDLRHAAYNGRGLFLSARDPQELIDQLNAAIASIGDRTSSATSAAVNTGALNANAQIYQARFNSGDWSGEFLAYAINLDGSIGTLLGEASTILDGQHWGNGREILSYQGGAGIKLRWGKLSAANKTLFRTNPATGVVDDVTTGKERMRFVRGKRSFEATDPYQFRERSTVLGDLVHSSPVYIGPDSIFPYPDSIENPDGKTPANNYSSYVFDTIVKRDAMVYVGANDGFLHGFHGVDGDEIIAYLPGVLLPEITKLTDPAYLHRFYVDGESSYQDVFFGGAWHTVLVGTLRHGGQGVYALDVSDPADFDEANAADLVLWEFTDADDADMGYSYSQASIVKLNTGTWAAIFGNGYNATEADGNASADGNAVLYIVDIETGALIESFSTEAGIADDPSGLARPNGLASPIPIDFNGDNTVDYVYAGDLYGNVWKFDISDDSSNKWGIPFAKKGKPAPLFTATIDMAKNDTRYQPITVRPEVSVHPDGEGVLVYFGTGQYIETGDHTASNQMTQTFYAVWDDFPTTGNPPSITRSDMLQQEIVKEGVFPLTGIEYRLSTQRLMDWTKYKGWYVDLYNTDEGTRSITDNEGERQTSDPILRSGRIIFTTLIPSGDLCSFGGTGWLMEFDSQTGSRLGYTPFDLNEDTDFDADDFVTETITADDNGDGKETTVTVTIPASGKKSREGMAPKQTIIAAGDKEFKYSSGTTGAIEVTRENPGPFAEARSSWRRVR